MSDDWFRDHIVSWTDTDGQPWDPDKWPEPTPIRPPQAALEPAQAPVQAVAATPRTRVNPLPPLAAKPPPKPVDRSRGLRFVLEDLLRSLKP